MYIHCNPIQGNSWNDNRIPVMKTGFPLMKTGFSLWELTYREFSVSLTWFGFAVHLYDFKIQCKCIELLIKSLLATTVIVSFLCRTFYFHSTRGFARHRRLEKGSLFFDIKGPGSGEYQNWTQGYLGWLTSWAKKQPVWFLSLA